MTKIKLFKKDEYFVGFECSGHTGYDESGKDILCATISGITQSVTLGLREVCGIKIKLNRNSGGYLKVELPSNLDIELVEKSQVLFETLKVSIEDLITGYSKYISMEVIENVY
ncbi:MAG: ribosomal-processing cysteine protease Prp [Christensenellales bacterium]